MNSVDPSPSDKLRNVLERLLEEKKKLRQSRDDDEKLL